MMHPTTRTTRDTTGSSGVANGISAATRKVIRIRVKAKARGKARVRGTDTGTVAEDRAAPIARTVAAGSAVEPQLSSGQWTTAIATKMAAEDRGTVFATGPLPQRTWSR